MDPPDHVDPPGQPDAGDRAGGPAPPDATTIGPARPALTPPAVLPPLVLASASPRRRALLESFGIAPTVHAAEIDERAHEGEAPADLVARLATEKAAAVAATFVPGYQPPHVEGTVVRLDDVRRAHQAAVIPVIPVDDVRRSAAGATPLPARDDVFVDEPALGAVVVAADTVVVLEDQILNKPRDIAEAQRMLRSLEDREHEVLTAIAVEVVGAEGTSFADVAVDRTVVRFGPLPKPDLLWYLATHEPLDKAGAYGIQGLGSLFVTGIHGNYQTVVGLSLPLLNTLLHRAGYDLRHWAAPPRPAPDIGGRE